MNARVTLPVPGLAQQAIDPIDAMLIHRLHGDFPLSEHPYREVGMQLGLTEQQVIARLLRMLEDGLLTRFGPLFQIERAGGQFVLAAMQVPERHFDAVAAQVNALDEVAHNYRREHAFNMWFVLACTSGAAVLAACERIKRETGLQVYTFPKEKEFFVELRLPV